MQLLNSCIKGGLTAIVSPAWLDPYILSAPGPKKTCNVSDWRHKSPVLPQHCMYYNSPYRESQPTLTTLRSRNAQNCKNTNHKRSSVKSEEQLLNTPMWTVNHNNSNRKSSTTNENPVLHLKLNSFNKLEEIAQQWKTPAPPPRPHKIHENKQSCGHTSSKIKKSRLLQNSLHTSKVISLFGRNNTHQPTVINQFHRSACYI